MSTSEDDVTDKEKLEKLLTEFGVEYQNRNDINVIKCEQGYKKVGGYIDFYTSFEFNIDGSFKEIGAWE